jgi:three-Cys-motif partner protein
MAVDKLKHDEVGYWSEVKLDIVKKYAGAYSKILASFVNKGTIRKYIYIDAFAGAGEHWSRRTGEYIPGSPLNALNVSPPFGEYHLIDLDAAKIENLRKLTKDHANVTIHEGNCNDVLLTQLFPRVRYQSFERALCLLDPYGLTLDWKVLAAAGQSKAIEVFLNFPVMDINRNALWHDVAGVDPEDKARMTAFWGDDSWTKAAYHEQGNLFGDADLVKKGGNVSIVKAFRERLRDVAGFKNVPEPMPMRNKIGAVVYYLFFASQNKTGNDIVRDIFKSYQTRGAS